MGSVDKQVPCIRFDNRGRIRPDGFILRWAKPGEMVSLYSQNTYYFQWWVDVLFELDIIPDDEVPSTYHLARSSEEW